MKFKPRHKFGAIRCEADGIKFPSKLEREAYFTLKRLQENKHIVFFLRQVPFDIPTHKKHIVDYCVFTKDSVIFIECKGKDLPLGKLKRELVEHLYCIDIKTVKSAGEINETLQLDRQ